MIKMLKKNDQNNNDFIDELYIEVENQIRKYIGYIKIFKLIGIFSFLIFLVILTINISVISKIQWLYSLIPLLVTLMSLTMVFNLYLTIQYKINNYGNEDNIGTIISYYSLNIMSMCLFIYFILLYLKLQGVMVSLYATIGIAIYILFGVCLLYYIFIFPALYEAELYFELVLIINYMIESFIFFVLLNSKSDNNSQIYFTFAFIPLWVAFALHFAYLSYCSIKEEKISTYFSSFLLLIIIVVFSVLLCLKYDSGSKIENWIFGILLIIAYLIFATDYIFQIYLKKEEKHEENQENIRNIKVILD